MKKLLSFVLLASSVVAFNRDEADELFLQTEILKTDFSNKRALRLPLKRQHQALQKLAQIKT